MTGTPLKRRFDAPRSCGLQGGVSTRSGSSTGARMSTTVASNSSPSRSRAEGRNGIAATTVGRRGTLTAASPAGRR